MLRRTQTVVLDLDTEAQDASRAEAERPAAPRGERPNFDTIRAEVQRNFAAHMDLGSPEPAPPPSTPPEPERFVVTPKVERRRIDTLRAEAQKNTTVKFERRRLLGGLRITPSRVGLLLVALLAGGLAAYLATQHEQPAAPAVAQAAVTEPVREARTQILVAKQAIAMGQRLSPATLEWADWPEGAVRPEYLTAAAAPGAITEMAGSVARSEILPGEPIRREKLAPAGGGFLSSILDNGMRGVSVSVTADSASGGFIVPNDHVDVVLTRASASAQGSETVLSNVQVLGINAKLGQTGAGATGNTGDPSSEAFTGQAIATLALDPKQAEVILDAAGQGKLALVLRPTSETAGTGSAEESAANAAIRLSSPFWAK